MTPRRRPANRKGPRSLEHRKLHSPHLLSPCGSRASTFSLDMAKAAYEATPPAETSQESQDASEHEEATAAAAAAIEAVVAELETAGDASAASASSDGETTAMLQHMQQLQRQREVKEGQEQALRRSQRKRRTVDMLSPSEETATRHKRRAVDAKRIKVEKLLRTRPAAAATDAARAAAAAKEKKLKQATGTTKRKIAGAKVGKAGKGPKGVLSPVQDEQKKTPQKKRNRKARRSLDAQYSYESETQYVAKLIAELYEEQEQDDRGMYSITKETVLTETSSCARSQEVDELSLEEFRRLMTYGEVSVESIAATILPLLNLDEDDVFFDLGCGTGKILVQAALQTSCKRTIGIELMQNRVLEGHKALKRLKALDLSILHEKQIEVFRGDIFVPPEEAHLMDATVVFINNVMFGPVLMLKVLALLKDMPKLRCVVTLRKICERHGNVKCTRAGNYCIAYVHPPIEAEIDVSWADKTSVYLYESLEYKLCELTRELAHGAHQVVSWESEDDLSP
ncbi:hypothetical protein PRIC2_012765 [Phytophthora ramorum]